MTMNVGRKGQLYVIKETSYGEQETLASANAVRHVETTFGWNPYNRVTSPEKKQSPGPANRFDRKKTAELQTLDALIRPSGVLNTLPELDPILEAGFGSKSEVTLATTVEAAPAPTATGATVADAGTLAIGDLVLITVSGQSNPSGPFVRYLTGVAGAALTWSPALPAAPTTGDALKGGITYKLTTDLALSLTIAHYNGTKKKELVGVGIDALTLTFDGNEEPRINAAGPAKEQLRSGAQSKPAAFTTVGNNPPSGLIGQMYSDGAIYKFKSLEIAITNGLLIRNQEYGVNGGTEVYRSGRREIAFSMESFTDDDSLYDFADSGANIELLKQTGYTEGNIVAVYAPKVEFTTPEEDDPDEETSYSFNGMALETLDTKNDEISLGIF